jgi:hypothetical protein
MTEAWLVIDPKGKRSVFLDREHAMSYSVRVHGIVYELVRRHDT